jgi:hypothetical protein
MRLRVGPNPSASSSILRAKFDLCALYAPLTSIPSAAAPRRNVIAASTPSGTPMLQDQCVQQHARRLVRLQDDIGVLCTPRSNAHRVATQHGALQNKADWQRVMTWRRRLQRSAARCHAAHRGAAPQTALQRSALRCNVVQRAAMRRARRLARTRHLGVLSRILSRYASPEYGRGYVPVGLK